MLPKLPAQLENGSTKDVQNRQRERAAIMENLYTGTKFSLATYNKLGVVQGKKMGIPGIGYPLAIYDNKINPSLENVNQVKESYNKIIGLYKSTGNAVSGYLTFNNVKFDTGLTFQEIFAAVKYLHQENPYKVSFTVDRLGNCTSFKLID
jgi:hypothetical protein